LEKSVNRIYGFLRKYVFWPLFRILSSAIVGTGVVWLFLEPYFFITKTTEVPYSFWSFIVFAGFIGFGWFLFNGYCLAGYLKRSVVIRGHSDTSITIKFGNIFKQKGWKAISVNDFFDSKVDGEVIDSSSLHGQVIKEYWQDDGRAWKQAISTSLEKTETIEKAPSRSKGNQLRYPIGTTASNRDKKFLFVALGQTDPKTHEVSANAESLIQAVKGLIKTARATCGNDPLFIPLMGSALGRVPGNQIVVTNLILTAIFEEAGEKKVTAPITLVLPPNNPDGINLQSIAVGWKKHG